MATFHIGQIVDEEKEVMPLGTRVIGYGVCWFTSSLAFVFVFLQQPEITKDFFKLRAELEEKV